MSTRIDLDTCEHPFLNSLPPALQPILLENSTRAKYGAGEVIFRQGEPANRFFLIEEGRVAVEACSPRHGVVQVQVLAKGDVLGWSWLFEPFMWNFQARALEPVTLLVLDAAHLLRLSNENHEFGYELMKRMVRVVICRVQAARRRLIELTGGQPV